MENFCKDNVVDLVDYGQHSAPTECMDAADYAIDAANTAFATNEAVEEAEGSIEGESGRAWAEKLREDAEKEREDAEKEREDAEELRIKKEGLREKGEESRAKNEGYRKDAEDIRLANEGSDDSQSGYFQVGRCANERERVSNENARIAAEGSIADKSGRAYAEKLREDAEKEREDAEKEREDAEELRIKKEGLREKGESDRYENYGKAEGSFDESEEADDSRWGKYKKAEGSESSTIGDGSRWGAYYSHEDERNKRLNKMAEDADKATTEASKVNAILTGSTLTVTNRDGESKEVDLALKYRDLTDEQKAELQKPATDAATTITTEWQGSDGKGGLKKEVEDATDAANTAAANVDGRVTTLETEVSDLSAKIGSLNSELIHKWEMGKYWFVSENNKVSKGGYERLALMPYINVKEGDSFYVKTHPIANGVAYILADDGNNVIASSRTGLDEIREYNFVVPQGATRLYLNCAVSDLSIFTIFPKSSSLYRAYQMLKEVDGGIIEAMSNLAGATDRRINDLLALISNGVVDSSLNFVDGYVDYEHGGWQTYSDGGKYKGVKEYLPVISGVQYYYDGTFNANAGVAYYDEDKVFISGTNVNASDKRLLIPQGTKFMRISSYKENADHSNVSLKVMVDLNNWETGANFVVEIKDRVGFEKDIDLHLVAGYVHADNGSIADGYSEGGKYKKDITYIPIVAGRKYKYTGVFNANAGVAYYNENKVFISGTSRNNPDQMLVIPEGAKYFNLSSYSANADHSNVKLYEIQVGSLEQRIINLEETDGRLIIACTGDSVTEGMATDGAHTAKYGKSPYPARLTTILTDKGYTGFEVKNYGQGGERTPETCARIGGYACVFNKDVTLNGANAVSLGYAINHNYGTNASITGTALELAGAKDRVGNNCGIYFTQMVTETNPCMIGGKQYTLSVVEETRQEVGTGGEATTQQVRYNTIKPLGWTPASGEVIHKGTMFYTSNNRQPSVNVFYMGINDGPSLTLASFIERCKANGAVNGGRYIALGCTSNLSGMWVDAIGSTSHEKWEYAYNKIVEELGNHYIDLRREFHYRGYQMAEEAGLLANLSAQEKQTIKTDLANWDIPAFFCYSTASVAPHKNDVHLSKEGYHIVALLIYERMLELNYIPKR